MSLIPPPPPMAVEAHHLPLFPSQLITNRFKTSLQYPYLHDSLHELNSHSFSSYSLAYSRDLTTHTLDNQTGFFNPLYSTAIATTTTATTTTDEYSLPRKRLRDLSFTPSFTGNDISFLFQQHQLELDWLIAKHVDEVVTELGDRRRLFMKQIMAVVEEKVARCLKSKEEEMEKMKKLNLALEENVKSLCLENQIWRELAQSNEATANALRRNIKHLLVRGKMNEESNEVVEDAESCCEGESMRGLQLCKSCHGNESSVLLLPCRHLCICVDCCLGVDVCPVCNCKRIGSINVNLS